MNDQDGFTVAPLIETGPTLTAPADGKYVNTLTPAFTWNSVSEADHYEIEFTIDPAPASGATLTREADSPYFAPTGLFPVGTTSVTWKIDAFDTADNSVSSETRTLNINTTPITLTSPDSGTVTNNPLPTFTWQKLEAPNAAGSDWYYQVQISNTPAFSDPLHEAPSDWIPAGSQATYQADTAITEDGTYYWRVAARDNHDTEASANINNFSEVRTLIFDATGLQPPELVSPAANDYINDDPVRFEWKPVYQASAYEIQVSTADTDDATFMASLVFTDEVTASPASGITVESYVTDTAHALTTNTTYYWRVLSIDDVPPSGNKSQPSEARAINIDRTPVAVDGITLYMPADGSTSNATTTTFVWIHKYAADPTPFEEAVSYMLQVSADRTYTDSNAIYEFEFTPEASSLTGTQRQFQYGLSGFGDGDYYWRLKPLDKARNMGTSTHWTYSNKFTIDTQPPDPPVIDSPVNGQLLSSTTLDVVVSLLGTDATQVKVYAVSSLAPGTITSTHIQQENLIGGPVDIPAGSDTVTVTIEVSPIDGMKTIAATALDSVGNESQPSAPVSFILDRTDPKINSLTVQSYNPGSQSVTDPDWSGKLLVTVEFSEEMDTSTEPTVQVVPDNGTGESLTAIGMSELGLGAPSWSDTGHTWTGMVRIPKGPGYDGQASVSVGGQCKDLAGKAIRSRTYPGYIEIDTAPRFTIRIFYNPADEQDIIIGLESSEPLRLTPSCQVTVSGQNYDIMMNHISEYMYTGVHRLSTDQIGRLDVLVFGTDLAGNTGEQTKSFTLGRITVFKGGVIASANGRLEVTVPTGALEEDKLMALLPAATERSELNPMKQYGRTASKQSNAIATAGRQGLVMLDEAYDLGPYSATFVNSYVVKGRLDAASAEQAAKTGIYLFSGGRWIYLGAMPEGDGTIAGCGRSTGILAMMADMKSPELAQTYPLEGEMMDTASSAIELFVDESGSGIDPASITVTLDGNRVVHAFEPDENRIHYKPARPLTEGEHELAVSLSDRAGNALGKVVVPLQAPPQFAFSDFRCFPNPWRPDLANDVTIRSQFTQATTSVDIHIFDATGALVWSIRNNGAAANTDIDEAWEGENDFGDEVANGVYFCRIRASNGDTTVERTRKIAVLR